MLKTKFHIDFSKINWLDYLVLFLIIFITLFYGFAGYAIENMNEGLYAEIPREMLVTGNYLVPHLNFVPYLEKPPMLYWLIAISYHIFGVTTFAARLIPVLAGILTCFITFLFARSLQIARAGWAAAIILATSIGFIIISRVIIFDMLLTLFFSAALFSFYLWYEKNQRIYLWLCYACIALAFLTKGMLAIALIPAIILCFMLFNRTEVRKIFRSIDLIGIAIFLLITLPWVIAANIKQPGFAYDFFINEQVMRFLDKRIPRDYHHGPIYYYIMPLIIIMLPWTGMVLTLFKRQAANFVSANTLRKFLWCWFLIPIIFFSISKAKAQYYIIISIPALALLLGLKIQEYFINNNQKALTRLFVITGIVATLLLGTASLIYAVPKLYAALPDNWQLPQDYAKPIFYLFIINLIYTAAGIILNKLYKSTWLQFIFIAGLVIPWIFFMLHDKVRIQSQRSEIALAQTILAQHPAWPVYLYQDYEKISSILFYVKKRVGIVDTQSKDLYYGSTTPKAKGWFITANEFKEIAKHQSVYLVVRSDNLAMFNNAIKPIKFCQLQQNDNVLLLTNHC